MSSTTSVQPAYRTHTVTYHYATDSAPLLADIYRAASNSAGKPSSLLLWYHGGGLVCGNRQTMVPAYLVDELVVKRGWTLVSFDYRLVPERTLDDMAADVRAAERFVLHQLNDTLQSLQLPPVDVGRVFVSGQSAGGYLALQAGHLFSTLKPRAIVTQYAATFAHPTFWTQPQPQVPLYAPVDEKLLQATLDVLTKPGAAAVSDLPVTTMADPRANLYSYLVQRGQLWTTATRSTLPPASQPHLLPSLNVTAAYPPTLLIHGTADQYVPLGDCDGMAAALETAGVEHVVERLAGRDHLLDFQEGADIEAIKTAQVQFLLKYEARATQSSIK